MVEADGSALDNDRDLLGLKLESSEFEFKIVAPQREKAATGKD